MATGKYCGKERVEINQLSLCSNGSKWFSNCQMAISRKEMRTARIDHVIILSWKLSFNTKHIYEIIHKTLLG